MKKLKLIFGALALALIFGAVSCDLDALLGEDDTTEEVDKEKEDTKPSDDSNTNLYDFILTDGTENSTFIYYTSTQAFNYTSKSKINKENNTYEYEKAKYQVEFNAGKKTWTLYTYYGSTNIDTVAKGSYSGGLFNDGNLVLTYDSDYKSSFGDSLTLEVKNQSFQLNVYAIHTYLGAADAK